jgi:glycosyltransferase involved in cell wall biosynthesis
MDLVSIILSCHNSKREFIDELLSGLFSQTYKNWELIICDHNSNVSTKNWFSNDKRIKHLGDYSQNDQWQYLINNSQGEIIIHHHDDDISFSNRIEIQANYLKNNPKLDACSSGIFVFGATREREICYPMKWQQLKRELIFSQPIMTPTLATRRNIKIDFDNSNKIAKNAKDYEFFSRRLDIKHDILPSILVKYRKHKAADSVVNKNQLRTDHSNIVCRNLKSLFNIDSPFELGQLLDPYCHEIEMNQGIYNSCLNIFISNKEKIVNYCGLELYNKKMREIKSKNIIGYLK